MLSFLETAPTPGKLIASDSLHPAEGSRVSLLELKAFLNMDSSSLLSAWQDEALARDGVSREVPCSALKGETVPDSVCVCSPGSYLKNPQMPRRY